MYSLFWLHMQLINSLKSVQWLSFLLYSDNLSYSSLTDGFPKWMRPSERRGCTHFRSRVGLARVEVAVERSTTKRIEDLISLMEKFVCHSLCSAWFSWQKKPSRGAVDRPYGKRGNYQKYICGVFLDSRCFASLTLWCCVMLFFQKVTHMSLNDASLQTLIKIGGNNNVNVQHFDEKHQWTILPS